jgi:hypothetical protein
MLFIIDYKILGSASLFLVMQDKLLSSYLGRFSLSIRANSAALSSFP